MSSSVRKVAGLHGIERTARIWMTGVAILAAAIGLSFKAGLLSTVPQYDRQSWYLVSAHGGFIVTSQVDDEAACRKRETADAVCRSGSSLADRPGTLAQR